MRLKVLLGPFLLLLITAALPPADAQVSRKFSLPAFHADPRSTPPPVQAVRSKYPPYVQDRGCFDWPNEGGTAGTIGEGRRVEGYEMRVTQAPPGTRIRYRSMVQDVGWEGDFRSDGQTSGAPGQGKQIEAIQVKLELPTGATVNHLHYETY